ncbi:MAG: fused MFS/spermidine synthase [Planctomycetota bacterium]|jgi:spermidine synthase
MRKTSANCIMLIYFASGACSLIDEVVWVRLLKLTLGNTVYATSVVVSVFMAGLALGALVMARHCDRVRMHLRLYALLETLVTISALLLPWLLRLADVAYVWLYRTYHPSHAQLLILQVVVSAGILLLPSMLMGSTLPLLGRFVTALETECGRLVGRLYALNTLGAAVGCFLAGFVLIRFLGVMGALYAAAALNLLVAFAAWLLSRFSKITDDKAPAAKESREAAGVKGTDGRFYVLVLAFFMSGLISIGYELLWMRSFIHLVGGFTYVFSAVLTVYLLGNVLGAAIGSRLAKRLRIPAVGFALSLFVLGLCGLFCLPLLVFWTSRVFWRVQQALAGIHSWISISSFTITPLLHSAFLFFVPSVIMGIGFPIALQTWANHMHQVGRSTGTAYGANTIGAVVGGIVTGFVLIPLLGVQISISVLGLIAIWIAGLMWFLFARRSKVVGRWTLLGAALFFTIVTAQTPANLFRTLVQISTPLGAAQLVRVQEGVTTTVSLHRDPLDGVLGLCASGQNIAGDSYAERTDQKMLGHFGVLLNHRAKSVLSVGFGSGETTYCLAQHKLENIDCVEIAPEVVHVSLEYFTHINLGEKLDEQVNMIYMDAKNYLHLTDSGYDVIVNDSIHPREFAENASLYAKEYFESAKKHLNANGLIMSWLPLASMSNSVFSSIIGTLMEVFPYVTIWYPAVRQAPLVLIVASNQEQYFSPNHIENELQKTGVNDSLAQIEIYNSVRVLSFYIADQEDLREIVGDFSINSDYWPFVEFTTDSITPMGRIFSDFVLRPRSDSIGRHIDWSGFDEHEQAKWLRSYRTIYEALGCLFRSKTSTAYLDKLKHCIEGLSILPDHPELIRAKAQAEQLLYAKSVTMVESGGIDAALDLAAEIFAIDPRSDLPWIITTCANLARGDMQGALSAATCAIDAAPRAPRTHFHVGLVLCKMGQFDRALAELEEMWRLAELSGKMDNYKRAEMLEPIATVYAAAGRFDQAVAAAERALQFALSSRHQEIADHMSWRLLSLKAQRAAKQQPADDTFWRQSAVSSQ